MKKCSYQGCEREVFSFSTGQSSWASHSLCLFHVDNVPQKLEVFQDEFNKLISEYQKGDDRCFNFQGFIFPLNFEFFSNRSVSATLDFSGCKFYGKVIFENTIVGGSIWFDESVFYDKVFFFGLSKIGELSLDGSTFNNRFMLHNSEIGEASLKRCKFNNTVTIEHISFKGEAHFDSCEFKDDVKIGFCKFENVLSLKDSNFFRELNIFKVETLESMSFEQSVFQWRAHFRDNIFRSVNHFNDTKFMDDAMFDRSHIFDTHFEFSTFASIAEFIECTFSGQAWFDNSIFRGRTIFDRTIISNVVMFDSCRFPAAYLSFMGGQRYLDNTNTMVFDIADNSKVSFKQVDFNECNSVHFEHVNLGHTSFLGSNIENIDFVDVLWHENEDYKIYDERKLKTSDKSDYLEVERLYHQLVLNYDKRRDHETAGEFYIRENEVRSRRKGFPLNWWELMYKNISSYGQSTKKPFFWILLTFMLVTALITTKLTISNGNILKFIYNSVLINLGFILGIDQPQTFPMTYNFSILIASERLIIIFLLSMFGLALRRRFRR